METEQGKKAMVEISKLSVEQIRQVKEQLESEVGLLQDSIARTRTAVARLDSASKALRSLALHPPGKQLLVPLTASLYVPGTLDNVDKILVDVGTGYYVEKTIEAGKKYCDRKISLLKAHHESFLEVSAEKRSAAEQVSLVLQAKLQQSVTP